MKIGIRKINFRALWLIICVLFVATSLTAYAGNLCKATYGKGTNKIVLATGSPGELGLLKVLADEFNKKYDAQMCWIKAGSGKSLKLLKQKKADVIMVHAPAAEKKALKEGWAIKRTLIGSNEFIIVGPKNDPAKIAKAKSVIEAYKQIATNKANFLSRGDNSGTHKKEMSIWRKAGIKPSGKWYVITHDFMMATLKKADQLGGYFMVDSSTWIAGKKNMHNLKVLFKGDPMLINVYHALCQPDTSKNIYATKFIDFVVSEQGQKIICNYGKDAYGEPLYHGASYSKQFEH